jgi:hypothetical protein
VLVAVGTAFGVAALVIAAGLFQPWRLFVDERVDDLLPTEALVSSSVIASADSAPAQPSATKSRPGPTRDPETVEPKIIRTGRLISHEHRTSGRVKIIKLADGRRLLRFEDLDTSSGPDLRVWLSSAPVVEGKGGWYVFGRHPHVELGRLKANLGNQNYAVPADVDLAELDSVSIWCKRFRVSFGAAALS